MQNKTEGIVLSNTKYNDRFSIVHIFTRDYGRVSYLLPKTTSKRSKLKPALFAPLSVLQLDVDHRPMRDIQRLKEAERLVLFYDMATDMTKISMTFFLSEFLTKVIRETDNSPIIYAYLRNSFEVLEAAHQGLANYHISFLLGLTRFIGIYPNLEEYRKGAYFDMIEGEFTLQSPVHNYFIKGEDAEFLSQLSHINYTNMHLYKLSRYDRSRILDLILDYYRLHLYDFGEMKSLDILKELF